MAELLICVLSIEGASALPSTINCCPHQCGLDQSFLYCKLIIWCKPPSFRKNHIRQQKCCSLTIRLYSKQHCRRNLSQLKLGTGSRKSHLKCVFVFSSFIFAS